MSLAVHSTLLDHPTVPAHLRLRLTSSSRVLNEHELQTLRAVCECLIPQPPGAADYVDIAAHMDDRLSQDQRFATDRTGHSSRQDYHAALAGLDAEARAQYHIAFVKLNAPAQRLLIRNLRHAKSTHTVWLHVDPQLFLADVLVEAAEIYFQFATSPTA
jgi:hypothetical protein